jgi:pilus assembly protein FimV
MKVADFDEAIDFGFEMEPEMPAVAPPAIMPSPTVVPPVDRNPFAEDPATLEPPAPEMPMESDIDVEIEDFDAPVDDFAPITQEATVADLATEFERVPATVPDIDFSDIDLELAKPLEPAGAIESAEAQAVAEVEPAVEPPLDPELWEEVNTKLDLSKAYLEMGDKDGAREILEEVLKEGDASQKALARDLIASAD